MLAAVEMPLHFSQGNAPYSQQAIHLSDRVQLGEAAGNSVALNGDATDILFEQSPNILGYFGRGHLAYGTQVGDLNGDSIPDLVTLTRDSLVTRLGLGERQFDSRVFTDLRGEDAFEACGALEFALGDLDGDDIPDVTFSCVSELMVWKGAEDGSFEKILAATPVGTDHAAIGDINGDENLDVVLASFQSVRFTNAMLGDGNGGLASNVVGISVDALVEELTLVDVDDDEKLDLVYMLANSSQSGEVDYGSSIWMQKGNGDGTFQDLAPLVDHDPLRGFGSIDTADMNGDGKTDLVVTNYGSEVKVWYREADGYRLETIPLPDLAYAARVVDLADEATPAIVATVLDRENLPGGNSVYLMRPSNGYQAALQQMEGIGIADVVDIDGDEFPDLLGDVRPATLIIPGTENGFDGEQLIVPFGESVSNLMHARGDFNEDGVDDLVTTHRQSDHLSIVFGSPAFRESSGDIPIERLPLPGLFDLDSIEVADTNDDGHLDLLLAGGTGLFLFQGAGDGTFQSAQQVLDSPTQPQGVTFADVDHDGFREIVTLGYPQGLRGTFVTLSTIEGGEILVGESKQVPQDPGLAVTAFDFVRDVGPFRLVVADSTGVVSLVTSSQEDQFNELRPLTTLSINQDVKTLRTAKLNDDNLPDFLISYDVTDNFREIEIYRSTEAGEYEVFTIDADFAHPDFDVAQPVDLSGDGIDEILIDYEDSRNALIHVAGDRIIASPLQRSGTLMHIDLDHDHWIDHVYFPIVQHEMRVQWGKPRTDGVTVHPLVAGQMGSLSIDVQAIGQFDAYAHAWIDFDQDGRWSDGEKVIDGALLKKQVGPQVFDFDVPTESEGPTWARVRLADTMTLAAEGVALAGEVEDYFVSIAAPREFDFGDAPSAEQTGFLSSYPVTLAQDGARHARVLSSPRLGDTRVYTVNGLPTAEADGEEPSEQDHGHSVGELVAGQTGMLLLDIQNATDDREVFVTAWIDANRDGDWDDREEQVINTSFLPPTIPNEFAFSVPEQLAGQSSFMRVRVSTDPGLGPTGLASDGEVVDFAVQVGDSPDVLGPYAVIGQASAFAVSAGTAAEFRVHLNTAPDGAATVTLSSADDSRVAVSPASLEFNGSNWMIPRSVTLTGVAEDAITEAQEILINVTTRESGSPINIVAGLKVISLPAPTLMTGDLLITLDHGETIQAGDDWSVGQTFVEDASAFRRVFREGLTVTIAGPTPWQNPLRPFDVDVSGFTSSLDALLIINALARTDGAQSLPLGIPTVEQLSEFLFVDVSGDAVLSALDALRVINELARVTVPVEGELVLPEMQFGNDRDEDRDWLIAMLF